MKIPAIEHIFFDLDHTLWDFDRNSALAFDMIFKKYQIEIPIDQFLIAYRPINMEYWKLYREEKVTKQQLRRKRLIDTFKVLGADFPINVIDLVSEDYINFLPLNSYLIEGANDVLEYLLPKYELHIITNGFREVQNIKLINANIKHYFNTITNSEDVGVKKPNPIIFEHAIRTANADVDKSIMIGDNYEADILGATSLGIRSICFNYHRENLPSEVVQISDLKQIKNYL